MSLQKEWLHITRFLPTIVKMSQDNINVVQARLNLNLLCGLQTLLALSCLLPLSEAVNVLIKFAKGRDVFICDL
jgi:hypothetical protein